MQETPKRSAARATAMAKLAAKGKEKATERMAGARIQQGKREGA